MYWGFTEELSTQGSLLGWPLGLNLRCLARCLSPWCKQNRRLFIHGSQSLRFSFSNSECIFFSSFSAIIFVYTSIFWGLISLMFSFMINWNYFQIFTRIRLTYPRMCIHNIMEPFSFNHRHFLITGLGIEI